MNADFDIVAYEPRFAEETVSMWRASRRAALGIDEVHDFHEHVAYLNEVLAPACRVTLALSRPDASVIAILASDDQQIHQLYVHVDYQRQGVGTRLVELARATADQDLRLRCISRNLAARRFYSKLGFEAVGRGWASEENLPDIEYRWESGHPVR